MSGGKNTKSLPITPEQIEIRELGKSYNVLKWKIGNIKKGYRS